MRSKPRFQKRTFSNVTILGITTLGKTEVFKNFFSIIGKRHFSINEDVPDIKIFKKLLFTWTREEYAEWEHAIDLEDKISEAVDFLTLINMLYELNTINGWFEKHFHVPTELLNARFQVSHFLHSNLDDFFRYADKIISTSQTRKKLTRHYFIEATRLTRLKDNPLTINEYVHYAMGYYAQGHMSHSLIDKNLFFPLFDKREVLPALDFRRWDTKATTKDVETITTTLATVLKKFDKKENF